MKAEQINLLAYYIVIMSFPAAILMIIVSSVVHRVFMKTWVVRRCIWPYPEGYATYNQRTSTILDTGLSYEDAVKACKNLNKSRWAKRSLAQGK